MSWSGDDRKRRRRNSRKSREAASGRKVKPGKILGPKDIPAHKCVPEEERSVITPGSAKDKLRGITGHKVTYFRCETCHVSMGSKTENLHY